MKLILSRKGFDSSAGGCPSPILPDGRLLSLPIPDRRSRIAYGDLQHPDLPIGRLVSQLSRARYRSSAGAHLDPDLEAGVYPREPGWRPVLGQTGSAQGHLRAQQIKEGDLFLFFGLFRPVERHARRWRFVPGSPTRHCLWGWLQIAEILTVDSRSAEKHAWLDYHPHCHGTPDANNTLYLAADRLRMDARESNIPGAGIFPEYKQDLQLSRPDARSPSQWQLPAWFHPQQAGDTLSYHHKEARWQRVGDHCHLQAVARGQEFVLELPGSGRRWLEKLIREHRHGDCC